MPSKENLAPKGANKRARSTNEDESSDVVSTKKQRVQEPDDTASQEEAPPTTRTSNRARKPNPRYAIEDSLSDPDRRRQRTETPRQQSQTVESPPVTVAKTNSRSKRAGKQASAAHQPNPNIYAVPDSDEQREAPTVTRKRKAREAPQTSTSTATLAPVEEDQPPKKRRGRPPRSQVLSNDPTTQSTTGSRAPPVGVIQSSTSRVARATTMTEQAPVADMGHFPELRVTRDITMTENEPTNGPNVSTVRGQKDQIADSQLPKGIMSPSKRAAPGSSRKSVGFVQRDNTNAQAAPEFPSASRSVMSNAAFDPMVQSADGEEPEKEREEDDSNPELESADGMELDQDQQGDEEDDVVCSKCLEPDSTPGNEILLCDGKGCNMCVHQKCYGVSVIPKHNWYCHECSQKRADKTNQVAKESVAVSTQVVPDIPNFELHLKGLQRVLLDRCTGRRKIKLTNMEDTYNTTYQVVEQTITAGEGNSLFVIGARGTGKTAMVNQVIYNASYDHRDKFHVVRLNGTIETDDKLAVRSIWRQLGEQLGDGTIADKTSNYADTMASLLALLSHPAEIAGEAQDGITSKSVIFLIDELDQFTTHARQTLLYNLFDIAQAKKAPIAVIGMTTRHDVAESLEKRVRSRFSGRKVFLSQAKSLPAFWNICRHGLCIADEDMEAEGLCDRLDGHEEFYQWWNEQIETLHKTRAFQNRLEYHYYATKSAAAFLRSWIVPLSLLTPTFPILRPPGKINGLEDTDSKLVVLAAMSDLDLSLLIAAARLEISADTENVNFSMAYDLYTKLMSKQRVQSASSGMLALGGGARVWGRDVALIAWERLVKWGLLVNHASSGAGSGSTTAVAAQNDGKMFKVDVALEEIPGAVRLNAVLRNWCTKLLL